MGGGGGRLLIGQLTIVVRIAHFIIRFRNVFRCFTVVILLEIHACSNPSLLFPTIAST